MPKMCIRCGKYPVFSHDHCKNCQKYRTDKKWLKTLLKEYKKGNTKPKIKPISDTQKEKNKLYEKAKKEKEIELRENGEWRCIFCGVPFGEEKPSGGWHHLKGRDGDLTFDKRYIFPCHFHCHITIYHNSSYVVLSNQVWYKAFLERLKEIDIKLYNKEINKANK